MMQKLRRRAGSVAAGRSGAGEDADIRHDSPTPLPLSKTIWGGIVAVWPITHV
jgi:hypothetical protein